MVNCFLFDCVDRLLSEYLGPETMLALVCRTYEGAKALETYNKDGSINKGLGIHAFAASLGRTLDSRFLVICLENLRFMFVHLSPLFLNQSIGFVLDKPYV